MLQQILRAPALKAVLIQVLAFPLMLGMVYLLARAGAGMTLLAVALLQGVLAALITWRSGLARWWCAIGLLFAPALLIVGMLGLPPWLFLLEDKLVGDAALKNNFSYDTPIAGLQALDKYTLRIRLNGIDPNFLFYLAMPATGVVALLS